LKDKQRTYETTCKKPSILAGATPDMVDEVLQELE
jgi:hypothetical protein